VGQRCGEPGSGDKSRRHELKLNPKQATESVEELSTSGTLNLPGLQVVLDLRNQFGFKLNKGDKVPVYYDAAYFNAARRK
jgi:hypothetical protein